jgi:hypothetical protein
MPSPYLYIPNIIGKALDGYIFTDVSSLTISYILINTIKNELHVTFLSHEITGYSVILGVNLSGRIEIPGEVHLQVRYKPNVI